MDLLQHLHQVEQDARRLRAAYARDLLIRGAVALDLAIRRLAVNAALVAP